MRHPPRQHMVLLGDLQVHAIREACQGAAEYMAEKGMLDFDPWPVLVGARTPLVASDFAHVNGLLASTPAVESCGNSEFPSRIPKVYFLTNGEYPRVPCVELDELAVGQMAAEHLLSRGYRNLAFIGSREATWSQRRSKGFHEVARKAGVTVRNYELPQHELPIYWSSRLVKRQAGLQRILTALPPPCGLFAANDVIACFVIETARFYDIGIPQQIGVVGVDDDPLPNAAAGLAISTVQIPFRAAGYRAAQLLDLQRHGRSVPRKVVLAPIRVVVRTSTDAFMVEDALLRKSQGFIEENRHRRLCVGEVAKATGTSRMTLNKHFSRFLDCEPFEYILRRRMEYAKELLRTGQQNVEEVSLGCGFRNYSYFCQVFKRVTGATPGSFRLERLPRR